MALRGAVLVLALVGLACDGVATGPDAGPAPAVHFIGRFDFSTGADTPAFEWPGSEVRASFSGSELSVRLDDPGQNLFEVWVDDVKQPALHARAGPATYPLISGLAAGQHSVRVSRRTESSFGVTQFLGFVGAPLVASSPPPRLIEFVGDSITCGYGVLGVGPSCRFSAATESESDAFGHLAADTLGVAHWSTAVSGIGLSRNCCNGTGTGPLMPEVFERRFVSVAATRWDFSVEPDVVVVNLGTNDFSGGDPGQAYVDAYDAFVQQVRRHYPRAWLLLTTSPMLSGAQHQAQRAHLDAVAAKASARDEQRLSIVELPSQDASDGWGCDYHPSALTQQRDAELIVAAVRAIPGW